MARLRPTSLSDRISRLQEQAAEARDELERLRNEEGYLREQVEKAEGQLEYYQSLLSDLRKKAVPRERVRDVLTRMS